MNILAYTERLQEAALKAGFQVHYYGRVGDVDLPVLRRGTGNGEAEVYISTGVHGDEPAGPMALLELLQSKALPQTVNLTIFPLVNPTGLAAGTRENHQGIDLNRDYGPDPVSHETASQLKWIGDRQFDFVLCLHEDSDGEGFYLYAHVRHPTEQDYSGLALEAARPFTGIDMREIIDEMPAKNGRMHPPESVMDLSRKDMPEALRLLFKHGSRFTFTTETPSRQSIADRIQAQRAVVLRLLEAFERELPLSPREF